MNKKAIIIGVNGQDGAYLSRLLLEKNYEVHGLVRRSSIDSKPRIEHLSNIPQSFNNNFFLHSGDITDSSNLLSFIKKIKPAEDIINGLENTPSALIGLLNGENKGKRMVKIIK